MQVQEEQPEIVISYLQDSHFPGSCITGYEQFHSKDVAQRYVGHQNQENVE